MTEEQKIEIKVIEFLNKLKKKYPKKTQREKALFWMKIHTVVTEFIGNQLEEN